MCNSSLHNPPYRIWVSELITPVLNTPTIVNHGLEITQNMIDTGKFAVGCDIVCTTSDASTGYNAGDTVINPINVTYRAAGDIQYVGFKPVVTPTTVQINTGRVMIWGNNKNTGDPVTLSPANFSYRFKIMY